MKGLVWYGPYDIRRVDDLPLPQIRGPRDAIVRVTLSAICGTDLHPYRGEIPNFQSPTVMGHEFTGVVEDVGTAIKNLRSGDRVLASDIIACGECWFCQRGWHYQCQQVSLFGYGTVVGPYVPGGQAEYVRIPYADVVLSKIPERLTDEQALFVGDILTTGYTSAYQANISPGDTVAVVGCGPVGLFALMTAYHLGAGRVMAIDPDPHRRAFAQELGGHPFAPDNGLVEQVHEITGGRGVDAVLEAVGSDSALVTAFAIVRSQGTISAVGAHHSEAMPFPSGLAFGRELTLRFSVGDPIRWREPLMDLIEDGRLDPTAIISHRLPLTEGVEGYRLFDQREATKVVLVP
jgi:threonine dehydrogenase-like Zn-dependent dehydrogenase